MLQTVKTAVPETDDTLQAKYGWIDRRGLFYPCQLQGHYDLATKLVRHFKLPPDRNPEVVLEKHGWIRITRSMGRVFIVATDWVRGLRPTDSQKATVSCWCAQHKHDLSDVDFLASEGWHL